jgi:hypothetical protein
MDKQNTQKKEDQINKKKDEVIKGLSNISECYTIFTKGTTVSTIKILRIGSWANSTLQNWLVR